jgi:hypothetical protein
VPLCENASANCGGASPNIHTKGVVVAMVLWKNAIVGSMERVWMHRMSITLVPEGEP